MPRYDDRNSNNTRLYVGHLSSRTRSRDLEHIFSRYGRVRNVDMKRDYAFVDFSDPRDADDARHYLDGRDVDGRRITVEFAKGIPRGPGGVREYGGRGPVPGTGRCFNCGIDGHWARDCRAGDWKNKCYRCGERGHIERKCPNSPKKPGGRSGRSYSRSPSPRRGRSRDRSLSRSRSYSRSRSLARKRRRERDMKSPNGRSPEPRRTTPPSPSKTRKRSPTPNDSPPKQPEQEHVYDDSGKENNQSPSPIKEHGEREHEEGYIDSPDDNKPNKGGPEENKETPDEEDTPMPPEQEGYIVDESPKQIKRSPSPCEGMKDEDRKEGYVENPKDMDDDGSGGDGQSLIVEDDENAVGLPAGSESP